MKVDFFNLTVQRLHKVPAEWRWWKLDANDVPQGFTKVVGSVPIGVVSRGPRKGWPKWHATDKQVFFISDDDRKETERLWSEETGNCSRCCGTGQVFESWSRDEGVKTKACQQCNGTGARQ